MGMVENYKHIVRWIVLTEAENGLQNLGKRLRSEWGEFAEEYGLKDEFNREYLRVKNNYKP